MTMITSAATIAAKIARTVGSAKSLPLKSPRPKHAALLAAFAAAKAGIIITVALTGCDSSGVLTKVGTKPQ
jgi:hypothetical protein